MTASEKQKDVFAPGKFGMEARAQFQQGGDASVDLQCAGGGFADAADEFQQGAFARAVAANDTDGFAALDIEADIVEGMEFFATFGAAGDESTQQPVQRMRVSPVGFGEIAGGDDDVVGHIKLATASAYLLRWLSADFMDFGLRLQSSTPATTAVLPSKS